MTTYIDDIYLYVPRHSRLTFVEKLDFVSGLGYHPARRHGAGPSYLITDLGQFDFGGGSPKQPRMRLISYHPSVKISRIQARTGFELDTSNEVPETERPTKEQIHILREQVDPYGMVAFDFMPGKERPAYLKSILEKEVQALGY